jgi:ABC-type antimicrobial peptide transport system permease subunit
MPLNFRTGQLMSDGRPVVFRYLVGRVDDAPPPALDRVLRDRLTHLLDSRSVPLSDALRAALLSAEVSVDATGRGFSYLRDGYRDPVRGLTFIGVVLLAMALCNIAGLSYSQTRRREREFMVREVLGADVWQQARLLSAELLWPVGTGLAVALPCAVVLAGTLAQLLWVSQTPNSLVLEFRPITVAAFTAIGVALTAAALASAMWARRSIARGGPLPLKAFHHSRAGVLLSASQCAVSVAAMFVAGILVHGVWNLVHVELGFNRERLVFARLLPARTGPPAPDQHVHYQRLVDEIRATPGIAEVALAAAFPRQVGGSVRADLAGTPMTVSYDVVSDEFFDVTGIGLRAGRLFQPSDSPQTDAVAILTEGLARALFPDDAALGRQVHFGQPERPLTVVGIVGDVRLAGPRQPVVPTIYTVRRQQPNLNPVVVARTVASSATMVAPLTDIINRAGRDYPVGMLTIENDLRRALAPERTLQLLSWVLGALVMMLVAIGLIAQQVTWSAGQRRSTVLRMVLGESTRGVMVRTARRALGIVAAGTAAGVPMALAAGAVLNRVLPGFDAGNPWLLAAVATVVLFGGTVASYWPTRFLAKLNPSDALRLEH